MVDMWAGALVLAALISVLVSSECQGVNDEWERQLGGHGLTSIRMPPFNLMGQACGARRLPRTGLFVRLVLTIASAGGGRCADLLDHGTYGVNQR